MAKKTPEQQSPTCDFKDTTTGHPCENPVEPGNDHCAAGHPVAAGPQAKVSTKNAELKAETGVAGIDELVKSAPTASLEKELDEAHGEATLQFLTESVKLDKPFTFAGIKEISTGIGQDAEVPPVRPPRTRDAPPWWLHLVRQAPPLVPRDDVQAHRHREGGQGRRRAVWRRGVRLGPVAVVVRLEAGGQPRRAHLDLHLHHRGSEEREQLGVYVPNAPHRVPQVAPCPRRRRNVRVESGRRSVDEEQQALHLPDS